jgi:hypothetical protein
MPNYRRGLSARNAVCHDILLVEHRLIPLVSPSRNHVDFGPGMRGEYMRQIAHISG